MLGGRPFHSPIAVCLFVFFFFLPFFSLPFCIEGICFCATKLLWSADEMFSKKKKMNLVVHLTVTRQMRTLVLHSFVSENARIAGLREKTTM